VRTCPQCSGDVRTGVKCPTCGAMLPPSRIAWRFPITRFLGCFGLLAVILAIALPGLLTSGRVSNDRSASSSLKTLASSEADFRANDRGGNGVNEFWTGDVAGLYCITGRPDQTEAGQPIKLIELSIAAADSDPLNAPGAPYGASIRTYCQPGPKARYWYWALRADASESPPVPYRQDTPGKPSAGRFYNTSRFGFLCYPDQRSSGRHVYIMNEGYTVFQKSAESFIKPGGGIPPGPVRQPLFMDWPSDATLRLEWRRMD
jgi:hypothetical protein